MLVLEGCAATYTNQRQAAGLLVLHPASLVVFSEHRHVRFEFFREVAIEGLASKESADSSDHAPDCGEHRYLRSPRSNNRPMTPEMRSQFSVSAASCFRPAFVIE